MVGSSQDARRSLERQTGAVSAYSGSPPIATAMLLAVAAPVGVAGQAGLEDLHVLVLAREQLARLRRLQAIALASWLRRARRSRRLGTEARVRA